MPLAFTHRFWGSNNSPYPWHAMTHLIFRWCCPVRKDHFGVPRLNFSAIPQLALLLLQIARSCRENLQPHIENMEKPWSPIEIYRQPNKNMLSLFDKTIPQLYHIYVWFILTISPQRTQPWPRPLLCSEAMGYLNLKAQICAVSRANHHRLGQ